MSGIGDSLADLDKAVNKSVPGGWVTLGGLALGGAGATGALGGMGSSAAGASGVGSAGAGAAGSAAGAMEATSIASGAAGISSPFSSAAATLSLSFTVTSSIQKVDNKHFTSTSSSQWFFLVGLIRTERTWQERDGTRIHRESKQSK